MNHPGKRYDLNYSFQGLKGQESFPHPQQIYWNNKSFIHQSPLITAPSPQSSLPAPWCPILLPLHRPVLPFRSQTNSHLGLARSGWTHGFHQGVPGVPKFVQDDEILVDVLFERVYLSIFGDGTYRLIGVVNIQCIRKSTWCACNLAGQVRISFSDSNQCCSYIVHPRKLTWIPWAICGEEESYQL